MKRLGYSRFAAQGGDWGGFVTNVMAELAPPELIGINVNFSGAAPPEVARALQSGVTLMLPIVLRGLWIHLFQIDGPTLKFLYQRSNDAQ